MYGFSLFFSPKMNEMLGHMRHLRRVWPPNITITLPIMICHYVKLRKSNRNAIDLIFILLFVPYHFEFWARMKLCKGMLSLSVAI